MESPKFFYVTYPLPIEMAKAFPVPSPQEKADEGKVPLVDEEDFEPVWYGNACFPEDE